MKKGIDYIGVVVEIHPHDRKGHFLLHKRSKNSRDEKGTWMAPGGALEFGESFEEGVRRELREEIGCEAKNLVFCGVHNVLRKLDGVQTHWVCLIYAGEIDPKKARVADPEKIDEIGWFTIDNLPKPLHSMYLPHLEYVKKAGLV